MSKTLKIAETLALPIDAATQTFAFIARKGAGKTYTAGKLAELLFEAGVQVIVLDTVGNWYGLRLAADGKGTGFDIPVLGGLRGDIPLEPAGGALIADIAVDTGRSVILDVSQWSKADRQRFATAFGERLWLRKKGERHPAPLHLVIEESQLIVPQDVRGDTAKMVGVYEEIIRLGRNYGIGVSMITQRPQSVNKEVLNQTECLFVGQVNGAQERDALKKWITHQGMDVHLVDELPGLKIGTFYVWSPQWLNLLERVQILKKRTFDASATPKVGDERIQRDLKPLDLADLEQQMKATIEKSKADDPRELRKDLATALARAQQLEREIKTLKAAPAVGKPTPVLTEADRELLQKLSTTMQSMAGELGARSGAFIAGCTESAERKIADIVEVTLGKVRSQCETFHEDGRARFAKLLEQKGLAKVLEKLQAVSTPPAPAHHQERAASQTLQRPVRSAPVPPRQAARSSDVARPADSNGLGASAHRILDQLAALESLGYDAPSKTQLAVWCEVSPTSGGYFNNLGKLRSAGLLKYPQPDLVALTDDGRSIARPPAQLSPVEMQEALLRKVGASKAAILQALIATYPNAISKDELADHIGVSKTSGGYFNNLGALRTLGVIDYPSPGMVQALPVLFLEGR